MGRSPDKRRLDKQRKATARKLRTTQHNAYRKVSYDRRLRSRIIPTHEIVEIDDAPVAVRDAISKAIARVAVADELSGRKLEDLHLAYKVGFFNSEFGPLNWSMWLGELLHRELRETLPLSLVRRFDVHVSATNAPTSHLRLEFRCLKPLRDFCVCAPSEPTIELPSGTFRVAYSLRNDDHFIKRLEERTAVAPESYCGKAMVFACLYRWQYFDPIVLHNGQHAARLWNWCDPAIACGALWKALLPVDFPVVTDIAGSKFFESDEGRAHYLVGYCPISEASVGRGYITLNTLLLPGMDDTPEERILKRGLKTEVRCRFEKTAARQTARELNSTMDFSVIRQYHEHVPQVKLIKESVFDYSTPAVLR